MNTLMEDSVVRTLFETESKAQEEITIRQDRNLDRLRLAVSNLMQTEEGKMFICAVLDQTGTFTSSFTGNSTTFFLEGKRFIGLYIYQLLMLADPLALQHLLEFRREQEALNNGGKKHA